MNMLSNALYSVAGCDHELAEQLMNEVRSNDRFALAVGLWLEGFSVIPLLQGGKCPARKWKRYQSEMVSIEELITWFVYNDFEPAIVTGSLSGITVIDCDSHDAIDDCIESGIESMIRQRTRRGMHFEFRHNGERNTVRVDGMNGVDRRGEGGYVKAYPESGNWTKESILMCETL